MEKSARTKVGFFNHSRSGCYWYRIEHAMKALNMAGIETVMLPIEEDINESVIGSLFAVQMYGCYPFDPDPVLKFLKDEGIRIVYDSDDALELIERENPNYHMVMKDAGSVRRILEYADQVTVSTDKMAEYMRKRTKVPVTVVTNCFIPGEWDFERIGHSDTRIGFSGSSSHVIDLVDMVPIISRLQKKHGFKFFIQGFGQASYEEWLKQYRYICQPEATLELRKLDEALKEIDFEWVPFVDYSLYPKILSDMALDIGICPLRDTPFNRHRSAVKAMEYSLTGALVMASDLVPYKGDLNSIRADWDQWERMLEGWLEQPGARRWKALKQFEWTMNHRNISSVVPLLKKVYME